MAKWNNKHRQPYTGMALPSSVPWAGNPKKRIGKSASKSSKPIHEVVPILEITEERKEHDSKAKWGLELFDNVDW